MQEGAKTGASDVVYDLVAIQYHALKGAQVYDRYISDAEQVGNDEIAAFFRQVRDEDSQRAIRAHELLARHTQQRGETVDLNQGAGRDAMAGAGATGGGSGAPAP